jgi:CheY-like chemotaxis protein
MKLKKIKPRVLFVDDDLHPNAMPSYVRNYVPEIAKELGLHKMTAFSPAQAKAKIALRLKAIKKLKGKLIKLKETAKSDFKKQELNMQLHALTDLQRNPFALIVSDINMPRGQPTGVQFAKDLRKQLPHQKVIMHSDDVRRLAELEREGFATTEKYHEDGRNLRDGIKSTLLIRKNPKR